MAVKISYWVNGWGPFETKEERDDWHKTLKELAERERIIRGIISREDQRVNGSTDQRGNSTNGSSPFL
jgi:hypothetical protein